MIVALLLALQIEQDITLLGDESLDVREAATERLCSGDAAAIPALIAALSSDDAEVRARVDAVLARAASTCDMSRLELSLSPADGSNAAVWLHVRDRGNGRVLLDRRRIRIEGITALRGHAGNPYVIVEAGQTTSIRFDWDMPRGDVRTMVRPVYETYARIVRGTVLDVEIKGPLPPAWCRVLEFRDAREIAKLLNDVFGPATRFVAVPGSNSIIAASIDEETRDVAERILRSLDVGPRVN